MKTLFLYDEITLPAVQRLIERMEEEAPGEEIRVYIRSGGGEVSAGDVLIDYLNRCPYQVELVAAWELSSTAFNVFFRSRAVRRTVLEPTTAQVHLCSWDTDVRRVATEGCWEYVANRQLEQVDALYLDWLRQLGLPEEQVGVVARKADLHLSTQELRRIIRHLEEEESTGADKPRRLRTQRKQASNYVKQ